MLYVDLFLLNFGIRNSSKAQLIQGGLGCAAFAVALGFFLYDSVKLNDHPTFRAWLTYRWGFLVFLIPVPLEWMFLAQPFLPMLCVYAIFRIRKWHLKEFLDPKP